MVTQWTEAEMWTEAPQIFEGRRCKVASIDPFLGNLTGSLRPSTFEDLMVEDLLKGSCKVVQAFVPCKLQVDKQVMCS